MCRDITKEINFDEIPSGCIVGGKGLDPEIKEAVIILNQNGVETFQSCQGGEGHSYVEPTIEFYGEMGEGFRALGIALTHGLNVKQLNRQWKIQQGQPIGPQWSMVFDFPLRKGY